MRIWFKVFSDTRLVKTETIENYELDTRTHKVMGALAEACVKFDLAQPIWLETNIKEFQRKSRTRFRQANFIEEIDFDYMEMQVLEEDY